MEEDIQAFDAWIEKSIYNACDGRPTDIRTLETGSYLDLLSVLNNYFEKVDAHIKYMDELERKNKKRK